MAFMGKIAYMLLFPGLLFVFLAGTLARGLLAGMEGAISGAVPCGPASSVPSLLNLLTGENFPADGSLNFVQWIAPTVKLLALSWISCIVFGFLEGDLVLIFGLLVLASASDLLLCATSANPRVRLSLWPQAVSSVSWAVPLSLVFAAVALRTGEVSISKIIDWQVVNGVMPGSVSGGVLQLVGMGIIVVPAMMAGSTLIGLRPFGRNLFADFPGGIAADVSGPPLAVSRVSQSACLFVIPLLLVALLFAGPFTIWYEVIFWALKVAGVVMILGIVDGVTKRQPTPRAKWWLLFGGGVLALAGLILVWLGV